MLNDGNILFEKIAMKMNKEIKLAYESKDFTKANQDDTLVDKYEK